MKTRSIPFIAAALLMAVPAASSFAGSVDVQFLDIGLGRMMQVTLNGDKQDTFAGQLYHEFSGGGSKDEAGALSGIHATFCTELTQSLSHDVSPYSTAGLADAPLTGPMGEVKAQAIRNLFAFADGKQFESAVSPAAKNYAAAFQLAVWEVVYDYDGTSESLNRKAGSLKFTGLNGKKPTKGILAALNELFGAVGTDIPGFDPNVIALTSQGYQDQIVQAVPVPAPVLLGAAGLIGVVWHRRRRARAIAS